MGELCWGVPVRFEHFLKLSDVVPLVCIHQVGHSQHVIVALVGLRLLQPRATPCQTPHSTPNVLLCMDRFKIYCR